MNKTVLLNTTLLITIALIGYAVSGVLHSQKPNIIVQPEAPIEKVEEGKRLPDFTFKTADNNVYSLSDFKEKIIVLNFWASWCPPCIKEFPNFVTLAKNHPKDVVIIALSSDIDLPSMQNFLQRNNIKPQQNLLVALDTQELTKKLFETYKLPETIIADRNHIMRSKIIGGDWEYETLEKQIGALLSE